MHDDLEINSAGLYLAITILWAAMRLIRALATRQFDLKRELVVTLLFVFLCLLSYRLLEPFRFNLSGTSGPTLCRLSTACS